jgi:cytochrome c
MDAFEINKMLGAVLAALLLMFGGKTVLGLVDKEHKPEKAGWSLPITEVAPTSGPAKTEAPFEFASIAKLLPQASAEGGQAIFKRCLQCHTSENGGPNRVGPNLWGIIGRKVATAPGFSYSDAMKAKGGDWSFEQLATYLHDPKAAVPGNKMAFIGIKDDAELADLLVYLRKLADSPPALPK